MADAASALAPVGAPAARGAWIVVGVAACASLALAALALGPVPLSFGQVLAALFGDEAEPAATILREIRAPRVLLAVLVGGSLAISGAALQGLLRNPLADPGLIGVTAGATVGAVGAIVLGDLLIGELPDEARRYVLPAAAFAGSSAATAFVFFAARGAGALSVSVLILAGVAVTAIAGAFVGVMIYVSDDQQLRDLTFWTLGSLGGASWSAVGAAAVCAAPAWIFIASQARALDLFQLGERAAFHSGVPTDRVKRRTALAVALSVGAATAFAGPIGFIGLVAPHIARILAGPRHSMTLPFAALVGAALLLAADLFVRLIAPPEEPPIGVATALIGGPFFLWLVARRARAPHA
ncbi:MAG: iron ABC transporter permease [Pseudomonadota bacterium]